MHLSIVDDYLQIEFSLKEQLLAVRFHKVWQIPLINITQATTELPPNTWKEIRAPGSFVPGLIKAGTYYTDRGKEFWYVTRKNDFGSVLTIDLENESYRRIILNDRKRQGEKEQGAGGASLFSLRGAERNMGTSPVLLGRLYGAEYKLSLSLSPCPLPPAPLPLLT